MAKRVGRSAVVMAAVVALQVGMAALAAPKEAYVCYKPDAGKTSYPWTTTKWWFNSVDSVPTINRVPSASDFVFLYSSKNDRLTGKPPMTIADGVHAETGRLTLCDSSNGQGFQIGVQVMGGGTITNNDKVIIGNGVDGASKGGGGYLEIENGGIWTAKNAFTLCQSSIPSYLVVKEGGEFNCTGEFIVGGKFGQGVVTNCGTMNIHDFFVGQYVGSKGTFVNIGTLNISHKLTLGRQENGSCEVMHIRKGSTLTKTFAKSDHQPVYIGHKCPARMVVEEDIVWQDGESVQMGMNETNAVGVLELNDANMSNITLLQIGNGSTKGTGDVTLNGTSTISGGTVQGRGATNALAVTLFNSHTATFTLNDTSSLSNVYALTIAPRSNASAKVRMRGGSVALRSQSDEQAGFTQYHLMVGNASASKKDVAPGEAELSGWGKFVECQPEVFNRFRLFPYGRIIADGEGEARDLDLSVFRTIGLSGKNSQNRITDGWYAVNRGRVLFPAKQDVYADRTAITVGDYPWNSVSLINSFQVEFTHTQSATLYVRGELYATDRDDIPDRDGLTRGFDSARVQGVWRAGFFDANGARSAAWTGAKLTVRYDPTGLEDDWRVKLLHHDGTADGRWRVVGHAAYEAAAEGLRTIATNGGTIQPSAADYTVGWFAVVAHPKTGFFFVIR